ncbi:MAG: NAD-dependent epimerase/dehydratase family protein [Actinobacteria bacterium]|nr:NAD-dependent epimerase/dehydratase family protein [Actinomycetota bacterium]
MSVIQRVLITGGCGFIGANLVRFLRELAGWELRVVDDLRSGLSSYADDSLADFIIGDVGERSVLEGALEGVDAVVHLAAQTGVIPSVENPVRDFEGNALGTFRVLEACRRRGIDRFIFASSGAALGEVERPLHEEVVPRPVSPYGAGKLTGEAYCQSYASAYGMGTVALRFSNVYGPYSTHKNNAIPNFIKALLSGEALEIFGDGSQSRDFIYVDDLCDAIFRALTSKEARGEVFQLATGVETTVLELIAAVQTAVGGPKTEVHFGERRAGEVYKSRVDISKVSTILGYEPQVSLDGGLGLTADWYRKNWLPQQPGA